MCSASMIIPKKFLGLLFSRKLVIIATVLYICILWTASELLLHPFIDGWSSKQKRLPYFQRKNDTAHIDCERLLHDNEVGAVLSKAMQRFSASVTQQGDYAKRIAASRSRLSPRNLSMSCEQIRERVLPPVQPRQLQFGIAYARIVYESYEFLEDELRSSYHQQNVFCYALDYKAKKGFSEKIETLGKCFPNVIVPTKRWSIGRNGINGTRAHHECMKALITYKGWSYVILLQNHDIMIKTIYETVSILQAFGGANDVHVRPCEANRYNHSLNWDSRSLNLYRDGKQLALSHLNASLTIARGAVQASLSRAAAGWMVNTIDLTKTFEQLDLNIMGVDEVLIPTLQVSDSLDMPGRFTAECLKGERESNGLRNAKAKASSQSFKYSWNAQKLLYPRVASWQYAKDECHSKQYRHGVCIYGVEDLVWVAKSPKLMANKMMPSFDYGAIDCMHELIFNRTHLGQEDQKWDMTLYENLPGVGSLFSPSLFLPRKAITFAFHHP
ncbi:Core-2/I-Branching enzyme [Trichostrongylus colubriformis]|uniref:Core-2/I-Branching enzyme n=1 Tax=Trichostrongylus colubriformis TaxID=6319 RepID=A0AAN8IFL8_TRICO